ncbi:MULTISPECIES: hypothetical protein [unclassified Lentimicrobium]|uniref:hypothetical protein n=1 Tax=unclassified Lentimicrobium TaxID=2677434 RepID=UPI0015530BE1|nr:MULTISPECIES: hypothetical protein [unclassified Lentimicrobium]NPD47458.1 hypothetical protein [Lentimicrobium sp. S6]NPD87011.1 hypothetical protein [Lentimicrobium sp. L6]
MVLLNEEKLGSFQLQDFDCMGELVKEQKTMMKEGAVVIDVPASGLVKFIK